MSDEIKNLQKTVNEQKAHLKKYEEQYKKLFKEVERLKEELVKYRGY